MIFFFAQVCFYFSETSQDYVKDADCHEMEDISKTQDFRF